MIERIEGEIQMEKRAREESNQRLFDELNCHVNRCAEMAVSEKQVREETENSLLQMIQDMESTLMNEINEERQMRERSEEGFMNLLEETCARIERNLLN